MEHEFVIGKYTLESLINGLYLSPLDLYREYIQNAVDSFDMALELGLEKKENLLISIRVDTKCNTILICDNGCGIESSHAVSTLIDIGNSGKQRNLRRGFRGIGRLAGLGYCDKLMFTTSAKGEINKTRVRFDAKRLRELLLINDQSNVSVKDVMKKIITVEIEPEKSNMHYFEVFLENVNLEGGLTDLEVVTEYLVQHAPLPFSREFKWRNTVEAKVKIAGYTIPSYRILLNGTELYKPYRDSFVSDRVKKVNDTIQDIHVRSFFRNKKLSAVLWYAQASYYGTINSGSIKGIRIRQGNILVGNSTTCNMFFKEERFNGWILGELHVIDHDLIANSRRDDFEKNNAYYSLTEDLKEWAHEMSKEIRKISCERSLTKEKKAVIEAQSLNDINNLCSEDLSFAEDIVESDFINSDESDEIAEFDYIEKLSLLLGKKKGQTKYIALNINVKLTVEQRKTLEHVFDLIQQEYNNEEASKFIDIIVSKF